MTTRTLIGLLAIGSLLAACNGSRDPFVRMRASWDGSVSAVCGSCPEATGAATRAECEASAEANDPFTGTSWNCQQRVYGMYPDELGPLYDCQADSVATYEGCIRNAIRTCPPSGDTVSACNTALQANIRACPQPDSIMAATELSTCFTP